MATGEGVMGWTGGQFSLWRFVLGVAMLLRIFSYWPST
jgi:hypothetical protein